MKNKIKNWDVFIWCFIAYIATGSYGPVNLYAILYINISSYAKFAYDICANAIIKKAII